MMLNAHILSLEGVTLFVLSVSFILRMRILSRRHRFYLYILGMGFDVKWRVQDIRHKFGKFNFFNKFVIFDFLHRWFSYGLLTWFKRWLVYFLRGSSMFFILYHLHALLKGKLCCLKLPIWYDKKGKSAWFKGKSSSLLASREAHAYKFCQIN